MTKKINTLKEYQELGKIKSVDTRRTEVAGQEIERQIGGYSGSFIDHEHKRISFQTQTHFIKLYTQSRRNPVPSLMDVIEDDADFGRMMRIAATINNNNQIIYKDKSTGKGVPANRELLYKMVPNLSADRARKFVKRMIDLDIIKEMKCDKVSNFFVNPIYTMNAKDISVELYCLFKAELDKYLEQYKIDEIEKFIYYQNNPDELVELQEDEQRRFEQESDALLASLNSSEENTLEKELEAIELKGAQKALLNSPVRNYQRIEDDLNFFTFNSIGVAIEPAGMDAATTVYIKNLIKQYNEDRNECKLLKNAHGLLIKKEATTTPASVAITLN